MKSAYRRFGSPVLLLLITLAPWRVAVADVDYLTAMLVQFLEAAHVRKAHEDFWADDLVYTSSNGTRFGKAEILRGFDGTAPADEPPAVAYSADEIDVRVYGTAAVVAFKLVGTPSDGSAILTYYNTGTFLHRGNDWRVVAWQATAIPGIGDAGENGQVGEANCDTAD